MSLTLSDEIVKRGRGKSQRSLDLVEAAKRILEEIHPATVRAVCYRLFIAGLIDSMSRANTNMVGTQLVWAREQGSIPWDHIVDETRQAETVSTWSDPEQIIRAAVKGYRKDYWREQPEWVEVWSEKGTVRGTLAPVLNELGVTFRVMHGYGSATALHGIAQETAGNEKPLTALYVGDWDPSGLHMSAIDLPRRLALYGGAAKIIRVALNDQDVGANTDLPSFLLETKAKDPRHQWFAERYGQRCWELDALSPVILRDRVRHAIHEMIDADAWNHAMHIESVERASMSGVLTAWRSISMQARK